MFSLEELAHTLLPREGVVESWVLEVTFDRNSFFFLLVYLVLECYHRTTF